MDTNNFTPICTIESEYEVVGFGEVPTQPVQIGDWWVMPAELYQRKVPKEAYQKLFSLIRQGVKIKGVLIADDMKKIEYRQQQEEKKKEIAKKVALIGAATLAVPIVMPIIGFAFGLAAVLFSLCVYDPMLICVLDDGRYICLHSWFD